MEQTLELEREKDRRLLEPGTRPANFICGVIEGFYGRPWTTDQRKDLFQKMKKWGMDSYVYAPKDDYKHRAYWRDLYTVEEAEHLTGLISAAKAQGIMFYYALSPGLDITYSNQKEIAILKRKLEQVSQFGCTAFALLFDDIEPEMSDSDKEIFQSFAHAQVSVTNEVQQHLGGGTVKFLLCPTQYCGTRAVPTVSSSEYLSTLGSKLSKDIDIMWTGPKVISKNLTSSCIEEITRVLRRPPVIWDNLHANDYDQKRMFLGPYTGRSPELIPLLRGVLANPNCEYNANTVPIRTLAHWASCSTDAVNFEAHDSDLKLERDDYNTSGDEEAPFFINKHVYHHRHALRHAVAEWLPEFEIPKIAVGPIAKPQSLANAPLPIIPILPSVNTCMSLTNTTTTASRGTTCTSTISIPTVNTSQLQALADVCTTVSAVENFNPLPNPVMNSLVSATKVIMSDSIPNPIPPLVTSNIALPSEIPVSTIQAPIMSIKPHESLNTSSSTLQISNNTKNNGVHSASETPTPISDNNLDIRIDTSKDKVLTTDSPLESEKNVAKSDISNADDDNTDIIVDDCDDIGDVKDSQNAAMSIESSSSFSPFHSATDAQMECTPERESAISICSESLSLQEMQESHKNLKPYEQPSENDIIMHDSTENATMQIEPVLSNHQNETDSNDSIDRQKDSSDKLTVDDLILLCDLFYLPFEHGSQALKLLQEFNWLKTNTPVLLSSTRDSTLGIKNGVVNKSECQEWHTRARRFGSLCKRVAKMYHRLNKCNNRELLHDLCGYVWELRAIVELLLSYIKWLALGKFPANICSFTQGSFTWFSKGWKEAFMSGDQEPWVFRGGLIADLSRLIPLDNGNDLLTFRFPTSPIAPLCSIRPYTNADKQEMYLMCRKTCKDGMDSSDQIPSNMQNLPGDCYIGPFLKLFPEFCMVAVEEANGEQTDTPQILAYVCGVPDSKTFYTQMENEWIPNMCSKYTLDNNQELCLFAQECVKKFHSFKPEVPEVVHRFHPALISCSIMQDCYDHTATKRLITCLFAALRSSGSFGAHVCINSKDHFMHQFYLKLGFVEINHDTTNNLIYLGRTF